MCEGLSEGVKSSLGVKAEQGSCAKVSAADSEELGKNLKDWQRSVLLQISDRIDCRRRCSRFGDTVMSGNELWMKEYQCYEVADGSTA